MKPMQESTGWGKPFVVSLLINMVFGLIIYGSISFLNLHYFDDFWTNWVLFVSCLAVAFIAWKELDPYRGKWRINGWITRTVGVATFIVLALNIGF